MDGLQISLSLLKNSVNDGKCSVNATSATHTDARVMLAVISASIVSLDEDINTLL